MIVAMLPNGTIGNKGANDLLWHIPNELRFFKEHTEGKVCVFGKNTYLSLPKKPLPNRKTVVLTDAPFEVHESVDLVYSIGELNEKYKDYIVCGGGSVYESLLLHVDSVILSTVKNVEAEGDLKFPIKTTKTYFRDAGIISDNNDFTAIRYIKIDGGI